MKSLFSSLSFDATNFLSYMILDVEQLHSSSHIKHPLLSKKEYCRDLWNTKKESTKRLSSSKVYYYTGEKSSWYPDPEHEIHLATRPSIPRLPVANSQKRQWKKCVITPQRMELPFGKQQTVRRQPWLDIDDARNVFPEKASYIWRQSRLGLVWRFRFFCSKREWRGSWNSWEWLQEWGGGPEYDSSTDKDKEPEDGDSRIPELDRRSTFLLGTTIRFGRQLRIYNRFLM